jgi:Fe-S-cluster containining protein
MSAPACGDCTSCCHNLAILADAVDVEREPRIQAEGQWDEERKVYRLVPRFKGKTMHLRCPFLRGWGCSIHPTRPRVCAAFQAGSAECAAARDRDGNGPL